MELIKDSIAFSDTGFFSKIAIDYIDEDEKLLPYIQAFPNRQSITQQIQLKKKQPLDRAVLLEVLTKQYADIQLHENVKKNIESLTDENTFTICTAHQPNIFTGPLYVIYKICHAIKLSQECNELFDPYHFVPVYYIGSEDNDIDEIGTLNWENEKLRWQTSQIGACGRMHTGDLHSVFQKICAILDTNKEEEQWLFDVLQHAYNSNHTLSSATRIFVNALFEKYGLVILDADDVKMKKVFAPVIHDELFYEHSAKLVHETTETLSQQYSVQAGGRDINLFYLKNNIRERIVKKENTWMVNNTAITFTSDELAKEIKQSPHHFSPNVILRPLYQEMILPNVMFVGGGGELAYWLELKKIFEHYNVVYPLLMLRNSFLIVKKNTAESIQKADMKVQDFFQPVEVLYKRAVEQNASLSELKSLIQQVEKTYENIKEISTPLGANLTNSVEAHKAKADRIHKRLEQKFYAQLKRNESDKTDRINKIKHQLFPSQSLQERYDNFIPYYKLYGKKLIDILIHSQTALHSEFVILKEEGIMC